jgi:ubiquinone biosynthesis protein
MDWISFFRSLGLDDVVPVEYDRYRPAIVDALSYFLEHVSPERGLEMFLEQADMSETASAGDRLVAIARHCPALHKLGQVLARDRRLSPGFRRLLQTLESMTPRASLPALRAALEKEVGPLARLGVVVDEEPLAEASVAVVIPFTTSASSSASSPAGRGVFKLLKPGIEEKLEEELNALQGVGALLDERCEEYGIPAIDYAGTFSQVRDLLSREVCLAAEQEHLELARRAYRSMTSVVVPEVFPFSTPRVTAMTRVDGIKVTSAGTRDGIDRQRLADVMVQALIAHPLWSPDPMAMFHADPHAGNLFVTDDNKLAILDWSLVGTLSDGERHCLSQVLLGALTIDAERIAVAIADLAEGGVDADVLRRVVAAHVQRLSSGTWPGLSWLTNLMDAAATEANARFARNPIMFRKVLHTLKGVLADVSEPCRVDVVLALAFVRQLGREIGQRAIASPFSRDFPSRISNAELWHLYLSAPLIGSRLLIPQSGPSA